MILFLLSLLAGVLTVLAPCTISLLPVIVGGTVGGGTSYRRAIVVTISLGVSIILFTLILKVSSLFLNIPQEVWQYISGTIIVLLGFAMVFPTIWDKIPFLNRINQSSNKIIGTGYQKQNILGDVLIGVALGPVFSSCSPTYFLILAEVLPRSLLEGLIYLLAYAFGLCASLLIIAVAGQKLLQKAGVASDPNGNLKRGIGILFLILGVLIIFGYDKKLELAVANNIFDVTTIEQRLLQKKTTMDIQSGISGVKKVDTSVFIPTTGTDAKNISEAERIGEKSMKYNLAPEITKPSGFINTNELPITLKQFKGKKVVLVDFWTYSCINCQRTLPYLKAWYDKYHDQGLEIVSIHTPEFAFEKVKKNVQSSVTEDGIQYPVVLDNNYGTWNAFGNQFWPRKYLIDIDGYIIYDHAGEGAYDVTEQAIQSLLKERSLVLDTSVSISGLSQPVDIISTDPSKVKSPEIYFGSGRNEYFGNGKQHTNGGQELAIPVTKKANYFYLDGVWDISQEYIRNKAAGDIIEYTYNAKDVYFVASSKAGTKVKITIDGKPLGKNAGADVDKNGEVLIQENKMYKLIKGAEYGVHTIRIEVEGSGLEAYTFTFG